MSTNPQHPTNPTGDDAGAHTAAAAGEWRSGQYRWTSPGRRYEIVLHVSFPPAARRSMHVPRGALVVWDVANPADPGRMRLIRDLSTTLPPGPELTALAQCYAYLYAIEDPATDDDRAQLDASSRDMMSSQLNRLRLMAMPAGVDRGTWRREV